MQNDVPMAKKKKVSSKPEEPEYEFLPPDFDEREYIYKDMYGTRVTIAVSVLAIVVGICAGCLQSLIGWVAGLVLMFVVLAGMKPFFKLIHLDLELIESKSMLGMYVLYLLLGLGIWILVINPPFA